LIELPYLDPSQQHHRMIQHHQQQHYHMYGNNTNSNLHYPDPYEVMENEAKKVRKRFFFCDLVNDVFSEFSVVFTRACIQRMELMNHLL
jgi:hypothetical protein